jgi:hypothetical protein
VSVGDTTHLNLSKTSHGSRLNSQTNGRSTNFDDDYGNDIDDNGGIDQVVTDLAILEHQLINSVTQRKDPLFIRPDLKDTIINDLDHYFEDKSSSLNEQYKNDFLQEQTVTFEHLPHITTYYRTSTQTRILIDQLISAQMYMFQVYACHDLSQQPKADACSLNGIIITVRTKPGDRRRHSFVLSMRSSFDVFH